MAISDLQRSQHQSHSLTLVGVGPGDPSLMTLAAVEAIQNATVVAYPVTKDGGESIAATIASRWIDDEKKRLPLLFPMIPEAKPRKEAWKKASDILAGLVKQGEEIAFLCEGDVSLFATASYVLLYLKRNYPECSINLIPGVTAVGAAAAAAAWPLSMQREQLLVVPAPETSDELDLILEEAAIAGRVLALLKLGKRWIWIRSVLEKKGLLEKTVFAQRVGFPDQKIMEARFLPATAKPYFSLLLIRQGWPEVLF